MAYMTALKRAVGHGSAREGTARHWAMTKSSVALLILTPFFVFTFGKVLGSSYDDVIAYYQRPFPAIIAVLMIVTAFMHFKTGVQMLIEDYMHGLAREITIILLTCLSYAAAVTAVFAIAKIAL